MFISQRTQRLCEKKTHLRVQAMNRGAHIYSGMKRPCFRILIFDKKVRILHKVYADPNGMDLAKPRL
ncbi:MAG: hypothetical protein COA54_08495 [Thiotrichaceae bacterium]|nr:MAG: hypothetical protein COA54_08495 [Thiotrichaceae bacterium]